MKLSEHLNIDFNYPEHAYEVDISDGHTDCLSVMLDFMDDKDIDMDNLQTEDVIECADNMEHMILNKEEHESVLGIWI